MNTPPSALQCVAVSKRFGRVEALREVSFAVAPGQILGLLGPNGSGKSTALKCALGLLSPEGGQIRIGAEPAGTPTACAQIGYLPERGGVPTHLTGREALRWWARLNALDDLPVERVEAGLAAVDLHEAADRRVATYSKGMRQRLALAQALLPEPGVLLLDEPFSGVDPLGVDRLLALLQRLRDGGTAIVLTSHLLRRVEQVCDEVVLLDCGRVIAAGTVAEVLGEVPVRQRGLDDVFREQLGGGGA